MIRVHRIYATIDFPNVECDVPLLLMARDTNGELFPIGSGSFPEEIAQRVPESFVGNEQTDAAGRQYIELVQGQ